MNAPRQPTLEFVTDAGVPTPTRQYVAWFRPSPCAAWQLIASAPTEALVFAALLERTRRRGGPEAQRFVTHGETPDAFFDALDERRPERNGRAQASADACSGFLLTQERNP